MPSSMLLMALSCRSFFDKMLSLLVDMKGSGGQLAALKGMRGIMAYLLVDCCPSYLVFTSTKRGKARTVTKGAGRLGLRLGEPCHACIMPTPTPFVDVERSDKCGHIGNRPGVSCRHWPREPEEQWL